MVNLNLPVAVGVDCELKMPPSNGYKISKNIQNKYEVLSFFKISN